MKILLGIAPLLVSGVLCAELEGQEQNDLENNCPQPRVRPPITVYCTETVTTTSLFTTCKIDYFTKTVELVETVTTCPIPMPTQSASCPLQDEQLPKIGATGTDTDTDTDETMDDGDGDDGGNEGGVNAVGNETGAQDTEQRPGWKRVCVRWRFRRCVQWRWMKIRGRGGRG